MEGISRLSTLIIQGNPESIKCYWGGPTSEGKYAGWIYYEEDRGELPGGSKDIRPRPLLSTQPIYETPDAALEAVEAVVRQVRSHQIEHTI
jgi:hypothetical protein